MSDDTLKTNIIYTGDSAEILKTFPDCCVDLTCTSPPYDDMDLDFNPIQKNGLRDYNGYTWDFKTIAQELYRVMKDGGIVVWIIGDPMVDGSESLASSLQKIYFRRCGFRVLDTMIYMKSGPSYPSQDKYYQIFEYMIVLCKGSPKTFNPLKDRENRWFGEKWSKVRTRRNANGDLKRTTWSADEGEKLGTRFNIWQYAVGAGNHGDELAHKHPASFPEDLARDHIESWSNPSDVVLDPFVGSGTTPKMCVLTGRRYIGIDVSSEYVALAERRVAAASLQIPMFAAEAQCPDSEQVAMW